MTSLHQPPLPEPPDPARLLAAHDLAAAYYRDQLLSADGPRRYLTDRGLGVLARDPLPWRPGVDLPWRVGYAPPTLDALTRHQRMAGFTNDELTAAGLARTTRTGRLVDTFRDRIMLPVRDQHGQIVAFIGRASPNTGPRTPKYLNSSESVIYHKGQTLFGLAEQRDRAAAGWAPVVVEGPLDVLAVWLAHPDHAGVGRIAVATSGTAFTADQAATVAHLPGAERHGVTVAFDDDLAGHAATDRAWQLLTTHPGLVLHAAQLPPGSDPADLIAGPGSAATLRAALTTHARPLAEAVIDHRITTLQARHTRLLMEVPGQIAAVRAVAPVLACLPAEESVRMVAYVSAITDISIGTVVQEVVEAGSVDVVPAGSPRTGRAAFSNPPRPRSSSPWPTPPGTSTPGHRARRRP